MQIEWLTSNTKIAYPFVERVEYAGACVSDAVVDAFFSHRLQHDSVRLAELTDPTAGTVDLTLYFSDGTLAFDSSAGVNYRKKRTFGQWLLLEWSNDDGVARLLLDAADLSQYTWPWALTDAYFVDFAVQYQPAQLKSVTRGAFKFDGTIELLSGFNVKLSKVTNPHFTDNSPARGKTFIRMDVEPGAGEGKFVECGDTVPPILTINGVGPDADGNFLLEPDECYAVEQPIDRAAQGSNPGPPWYLTPHTVQLYNRCGPCCDCDDYVYVYDTLERRVYDRAKRVADRIYDVRDRYNTLVGRVQQEKTCREQPDVDIQLISRHGWTATVQIIARNNQACPVDYIYFDVMLGGVKRATYVEGTGYYNSKSTRNERFDPQVDDPCSSISIEERTSSSRSGYHIWYWNYYYDPCTEYPHFHILYTDRLLGTDKLVVTFQVYYPTYAERGAGKQITAVLNGFIGSTPVSASVSTTMLGPHNKV